MSFTERALQVFWGLMRDGQKKTERKREASSLFSKGSVKKDDVREGFLLVVVLVLRSSKKQ